MSTNEENYQKFLSTYHGIELLKKHKLTDRGTWRICGEDSNCDLGGSHYLPVLDIVDGELEDIIRYAVNLVSFWTWGAGGDITQINVRAVTPQMITEKYKLQAREQELIDELKQIKDNLNNLGTR